MEENTLAWAANPMCLAEKMVMALKAMAGSIQCVQDGICCPRGAHRGISGAGRWAHVVYFPYSGI